MHLRTLRIRGFKSFPDALELTLEPGVAVVVGPNGSGKSNIADAIVWAAGSLTPSELRAEKPDDVLFAGGGERKAAEHCEVELVFDNEDGTLPEPRLLRGLDRAAARPRRRGPVPRQPRVRAPDRPRRDPLGRRPRLRDALDRGPGQGRAGARLEARGPARARRGGGGAREVQAPPSSRGAEARARRAAGRARARRRGGGAQAAATARAAGDGGGASGEASRSRSQRCERASPSSTSPRLPRSAAEAEERRDAAAFSRRGAQARLEGLLADRARAEDELSDAAGRREAAVAARYRLQGGVERLELRARVGDRPPRASSRRAAGDGRRRGRSGRPRCARARGGRRRPRRCTPRSASGPPWRRARSSPASADARSSRPSPSRKGFRRPRARSPRRARSSRFRRSRSRRAPSARSPPRSGPARRRCSPTTRRPALALLQRARSAGLGSLTVLAGRPRRSSSSEYPGRPARADLLDATLPSRHARGLRLRPGPRRALVRGRDRRGGAARARGAPARARRRGARARGAPRGSGRARRTAAASRAEAAEIAFGGVLGGARRRPTPRLLSSLVRLAEGLADGIRAAQTAATRFEAPLRARVDAGSTRSGELGEELRRLGAAEVELRQELEEASARPHRSGGRARPHRRRDDRGAAEARGCRRDRARRRRRPRTSSRPASSASRSGGPPSGRSTRSRARSTRPRRSASTTSQAQREDLERSLEELERLRAELAETVERRFAETFAAVAGHFEEVASTLFPGGEGRLRLVEPEGEDGEAGVEVELRPAGKRITRLSLLSGGEKALGAISFLFALFLARPCAFYLLDEVEAALDDTNIARFVELLRRYADRAQFVVVTHQKRTMEAADVLYGVTMGPDGVSQVVSRRLPRARSRPSPRRCVMSHTWAELLGDEADGGRRARAHEPLRPHAGLARQEPPGADGRARVRGLRRVGRRGVGAARGGAHPQRRRRARDRRAGAQARGARRDGSARRRARHGGRGRSSDRPRRSRSTHDRA